MFVKVFKCKRHEITSFRCIYIFIKLLIYFIA